MNKLNIICMNFDTHNDENHSIDLICIPGIGMEPTYNEDSCRGISLKRDECDLHLIRLPALASVAT